jgi:hypothetical protein
MFSKLLALALACATGVAAAQFAPAEDPDWKELQAPPPPPLRTSGLIGVEMPGSSLHFGVDPASVSVGADGIVRYVVVATSDSGAVNGIYEGVRCSTGEVKVLAHHNPASGWVPTRDAQWQALQSTRNSRYSLTIARTGACLGQAPNGTASKIVRDLRSGVDHRFEDY